MPSAALTSLKYAIYSDNDLAPVWHEVLIRTSDGLLVIGYMGNNFSDIRVTMRQFKKKEHQFDNVVRTLAPNLAGS